MSQLLAVASETLKGLSQTGIEAGFNPQSTSIAPLIATIINSILGLSGLVFLCILVYGGVLYLISQGEVDKVKSAKSAMTSAVIGMVIIIASYAIVTFIFSSVLPGVTTSPTPLTPLPGGTPGDYNLPPDTPGGAGA